MNGMGKIRSAACVGLLTLLLAFPQNQQGIKEIVAPYLGVYTCTCATLEGTSFLPYAEKLRIELKKDDTYTLFYRNADGKRVQRTGRYTYDAQKKEVCVFTGGTSSGKQIFYADKGKLETERQIGEKLLRIVFER